MMRQAKLCVVLLALSLGWHGLPECGSAWDYTQSTNFGVLSPGDHVHFKVTPPKNSEGKDAIVTKGVCDQPGGFIWIGGPASWNGTVPPDFAAQHIGRFSGEYGYPGGTGGVGRALTWKMDTAGVVIKITLTTSHGHGLWWFNGENAANYDESGTLTAQGATTGTFKWDVISGADKVDLNYGFTDADSITVIDNNTITIKITGASVVPNDVTVRLTYNGTVAGQCSFTTYTPKSEIQTEVIDGNWTFQGHINGYESQHIFRIVDQFNGTLPALIEINENWTENAQNDNTPPTTWSQDEFLEEAWMADPANGIDCLRACYWGTAIPNTQNPQTPLGNVKVFHWTGEHYAGSQIYGMGVKVLIKKWQYYQDHGRRE